MTDCAVSLKLEGLSKLAFSGLQIGPPANVRDDSDNGPHCLQLIDCKSLRLNRPILQGDENTENIINLYKCQSCSIVNPVWNCPVTSRESSGEMTVDDGCNKIKVDLRKASTFCPNRVINFAYGQGHSLYLPKHLLDSPYNQPIAVDPGYNSPVSLTIYVPKDFKLFWEQQTYIHPTCKDLVVWKEL